MDCDGRTVKDEDGGRSGGLPIVHVTIPQQTSVIQSTATSLVTSPDRDDLVLSRAMKSAENKKKELYRRPSFRKIYDELHVDRDDDDTPDSSSQEDSQDLSGHVAGLQSYTQTTVIPAAVHLSGESSPLQTLTMTNASGGTSLVQYNTDGGQLLVPTSAGGFQTLSLRGSGNLSPTGNMVLAHSPTHHGSPEEHGRKREMRLLKNREAARECRRKKKEYIKCLENRVAVLENQNKTLVDELKQLKQLYENK